MENNRDYTRRSRRRRELTPREKLLIILKRNIYPIALVVIIIFSIVVILPAEKSREAKKEVTASITEQQTRIQKYIKQLSLKQEQQKKSLQSLKNDQNTMKNIKRFMTE